jgi:hypothetical protein
MSHYIMSRSKPLPRIRDWVGVWKYYSILLRKPAGVRFDRAAGIRVGQKWEYLRTLRALPAECVRFISFISLPNTDVLIFYPIVYILFLSFLGLLVCLHGFIAFLFIAYEFVSLTCFHSPSHQLSFALITSWLIFLVWHGLYHNLYPTLALYRTKILANFVWIGTLLSKC